MMMSLITVEVVSGSALGLGVMCVNWPVLDHVQVETRPAPILHNLKLMRLMMH